MPKYDANWWQMKYNDPCTIALQTDNELMAIHNPYVANLVEMGYDEADCQMVASVGVDASYPREIHGRIYNTEEEYKEALADFLNGM
jgi:hypothetical protein